MRKTLGALAGALALTAAAVLPASPASAATTDYGPINLTNVVTCPLNNASGANCVLPGSTEVTAASFTGGTSVEALGGTVLPGNYYLTRSFGSTNKPVLALTPATSAPLTSLRFVHAHNHSNSNLVTVNGYNVQVQIDATGSGTWTNLGSPFVAPKSATLTVNRVETTLTFSPVQLTAGMPVKFRWVLLDNAGAASASNTGSDFFGLNFLTATFDTTPADTTAPVITPSVVGTLGSNGWYTSDVNVSWTVTDAESAITSQPGCDPQTVTADTAGTPFTCTATSAGGSASQSVTVKRDATAPVVDLTAPSGTYVYGDPIPAASCTASDATSGVAGSCAVSGFSTAVGTHTVTGSATDNAGNTGTATSTYTVAPWSLSGFYAPVDMGGVVNVVRGGSTVPLKFEVFKGAAELTDPATTVQGFTATTVACDTGLPSDDIEFTTTGGTSLRYDATAGQFIQNWQTPKKPGTCYSVKMTTKDGSALTALFKLK